MILQYLKDIDVDLRTKEVIPIGFDYGCNYGNCKNSYRSFSSDYSGDITDYLLKYIEKQNILNWLWTKFRYGKRDTIALGMSSNRMIYTNINDRTYPVKGLICSTNDETNKE